MDLGLKGKVFIVTGGGSGIGEAITRGVLEEGGNVSIVARKPIEEPFLKEFINQHSTRCLFIATELTDMAACKNAIEQTISRFGKIDCLVNNAGKNDGVGLEGGNPEAFEESLSSNLTHYYAMAHYALPYLKEAVGNIINISSKAAITGQGNTSGYVAAKGAQLALTREWAVELIKYNIRVNAIIPAEVYTPLYDSWIQTFENPQEKLRSITDKIPLGKRFTTSEEIANMALFLSSTRAAHITGQHLFVDGGYTHLDRVI
ncbi:MAG TPA: SDR family oxidoreductase [Cytophagaceae bacterium]|jgi:L-fucose dehydrogenase